MLVRWAPVIFILIWSTGFVGARLSAPYADPLTFLFVRMVIAIALLIPIAWFVKQQFPADWRTVGHTAVVGVLLHAIYLGGVFYAIRHGLPIAITALIAGLQPALAGVMALYFLKEPLVARQRWGVLLGLAGVVIVLYPTLSELETASIAADNFFRNILVVTGSLLAITSGTIYQKHFCKAVAVVPGAVIQYIATAIVLLPFAYLLEDMRIEWNGQTLFAMLWLVFVLSIGAILLLLYLIRQKAALAVNALFYLVPALAATWGLLLFGEPLHLTTVIGFAFSLSGVYLASHAK